MDTGLFNFLKRESKELVSAACERSLLVYLRLKLYCYTCSLARDNRSLVQSRFLQTVTSRSSPTSLLRSRAVPGSHGADHTAISLFWVAVDSSRLSAELEQPQSKSAFLRTLREQRQPPLRKQILPKMLQLGECPVFWLAQGKYRGWVWFLDKQVPRERCELHM